MFNLLLPYPTPRLSPPTWPCVEDVSMDAALDETFLPRGAQESPKLGKGEEKHGVKEGEGVESPEDEGDRDSSVSGVGV